MCFTLALLLATYAPRPDIIPPPVLIYHSRVYQTAVLPVPDLSTVPVDPMDPAPAPTSAGMVLTRGTNPDHRRELDAYLRRRHPQEDGHPPANPDPDPHS